VNTRRLPSARRRLHWQVVFAIAVFGLRALIPTGYMITAVDGHARLGMCLAGMHQAVGAHDMSGMWHGGGADAADGMRKAGHGALNTEHCPYAFSGGAGLLGALAEPGLPYFALLQPARAPAVAFLPASPPPRFSAPRGPPSLA